MMKRLPKFKNESEERRFWQTHDSTEYVDWSKAERTVLPRLKPTGGTSSDTSTTNPRFHSPRIRPSIAVLGGFAFGFATCCAVLVSASDDGSSPGAPACLLAGALWLLWLSPAVAVLFWPNGRLRKKALSRYRPSGPSTAPIRVPGDWLHMDCPRSEIFRRLPILGLPIGFLLYDGRGDILEELFRRQLQERNGSVEEYWTQYPDYLPVVLKIQGILGQRCWGFPPVFTPDDEYRAVGQMLAEDGCGIEAIWEIGKAFGVHNPYEQVRRHPAFSGSMLETAAFFCQDLRQRTGETGPNQAVGEGPKKT